MGGWALAATGARRPGLAELIGPAGGRHWAPTRKWQNRSSPGASARPLHFISSEITSHSLGATLGERGVMGLAYTVAQNGDRVGVMPVCPR